MSFGTWESVLYSQASTVHLKPVAMVKICPNQVVPKVKASSDFIADPLQVVSYTTTSSSQELELNTDQDVWTDVGRLITYGAGIVGC